MTSVSGWNLWVWLLGVVVRRYIDFLILLILYLLFFQHPYILFVHLKKVFSFFNIILCDLIIHCFTGFGRSGNRYWIECWTTHWCCALYCKLMSSEY